MVNITNPTLTTDATPTKGSGVKYFVKAASEKKLGGKFAMPGFQMDASVSGTADVEEENTKSGSVKTRGVPSYELSLEQKYSENDGGTKILEDAFTTGDTVGVWRVNTNRDAGVILPDAKDPDNPDSIVRGYPAKFGKASVSEFSISDPVDGASSVSATLPISGGFPAADEDSLFPLSDAKLDQLETLYQYMNPDEYGKE